MITSSRQEKIPEVYLKRQIPKVGSTTFRDRNRGLEASGERQDQASQQGGNGVPWRMQVVTGGGQNTVSRQEGQTVSAGDKSRQKDEVQSDVTKVLITQVTGFSIQEGNLRVRGLPPPQWGVWGSSPKGV